MDPGRLQQQDKKQLLQQQQLLLQKQLQHQHQHQQILKQQQQQLKPQQQVLQAQYLQQQLSPNQQQLQTRNQDFLKQRGTQHGNLSQQQLQEHQKNQDQAIIEFLELHDNNEYEEKNQEDCLIVQREQVSQPLQQSSLQRQQPLQQLQSQLVQQSQLGQQPQHQQQPQFLQHSQQQFQNVQQLQNVPQIQNLQQLQTAQQPQLLTQPQIVPKIPVVGQPSAIQKPTSLQQSQIVQQHNNQYSPVSTQQQSKKQPPPHTQQLLQQQLQQLLLKNKNYSQRIVVLGNQPQQQQLSLQQSQRVVTSNSNGQQSQQMQCVVVTNAGQQPQQIQRVVVAGTGQQQQQHQIQRVMVGNNGQQQPQQMQRVVVTSNSQQMQQQQFQHVVIPGTSQQQSHQVQNVVTQTSIQQQPQQLQRVVVAPTGQQQVQRVVTSTSSQQQQLAQQHPPVQQRIVIGQLKTSQQTQQLQSPSQNGAVLNQQVIQRPIGSIQQQQRVVIAGQQQILKLTNQQHSQQQITLQKQLAHKLLQPTPQKQQQDVVKNQQKQLDEVKNQLQQQQQDVVKNQQKQLDVVKNQQQQLDEVKSQQQQNVVKNQHQKLSQGIVPLTQQQKNNFNLSNETLAKELHIKQSHQLLQQLHIQPSQKHSQEQINKQLQQQKLKQKNEIDQLQHQLKQPQRSGVIVGQLQQSEKPEPEKLKKQLEMQQQQRQKLQERLILQQRQQQQQKQQQQKQKLKEQQLQQKHQQQLREQVLLQQHLKQLQQQQLQKKLLLRQQASPENRLSLVVNGNQDQKIQDEENTINRYEKSKEAESLRHIGKATTTEKQYQLSIKQNNNENAPVSEKEVLLSSSDDDDDETIRKQRNLLREAERLVQERNDALTGVLGSKYKAQYDEILRNWLASQISREEFDREIRKVLYVSWIATKKHVDASIKTNNNSCSKKTTKKDAVATILKIKEDNGSLIDSTAQKSKLAEIHEDIDVNIDKKEVKAILADRVPLHNALVTSLIKWMPLNCQWLEQRKARSQGVSVSGSPLRLYTYADVPQVRGPSDHWYPNVPGSLAHWYWPNNLPCKSSFVENIEHLPPKISFYEQEKKKVADAVAAAVLIKPPSRKLLPLLMEVAENTEKLRKARQIQYQKRFPKNQNAKITKRLQWQRLQEQKRLATMMQLRDGCSKLLRELKMRLRCLANQEDRLIEQLRRLQIRMSRRRRQVLAQFKIRQKNLKNRLRKFFDRSYLEQPNNDPQEHLHTDGSSIEGNATDDDEYINEEEPVQNWKEVYQLEKIHGNKKQFKTTIANHQSKISIRGQRPQSSALTIRLLRDRQRFLATTRLLEVTKQERLQISSHADYVREVRNKNCPCGETDNKPCQYRRQIRKLRKKLRARELVAIKKDIDQELVRKAAEREKIDAEKLHKSAATETEKTNAETKKTKVMAKLTNRKNVILTNKNTNVEAEEEKSEPSAKGKSINDDPVNNNVITNNNTSKKTTSLGTINPKNVETKVLQITNNPDKGNKGKHNIGINNCEILPGKCLQQTRIDILGDPKNRIRPPLPKDKRSVVNVADAAARAAQAALAASKKTQLRKTRAAAAAAAAAASAAAIASSSGKVDNDRRASELMPPPPPPPLLPPASPKSVTNPRNPTIGARYLQQQKFLLDRHRQLERIRRDEEERRQRSQDECVQQDQECSDREVDETNMKMKDSSSPYISSSQRMRSKQQKVPVGAIRQDMNRVTDNEEQSDFSSPIRSNAKNGEESQQFSDYYYYYSGGDYYSSDEESPGSSFMEPPFPPLMHDLRIDQLPRPTNRMPTAAVLPPGVRTRLLPMRSSNSNIHDVESSAPYNKPEVETLQERITIETDHGRNINDLVQKESLDCGMEFSLHSKPLNSNTMADTCKITESDKYPCKMLSTKMSNNESSKVLQNEVIVRREQQKMQQDKINDTKTFPERRKRRQDADRLHGAKKTFDKVQQERQDNGNLLLKTNPLTEWSKLDSKQVSIISVTETNSFVKDKKKQLNNQLQQQKSMGKIIRTVPSSRVHDTRVDIEELRSVQWKAPLTQWNKRPVEYEAAVKQRYPIQNKGNDLQPSRKEKVLEYTSTKFEVSKHHLNNQQQKLRSEVDRQKLERVKLQNMVYDYQKLVDTLPVNDQLQHMNKLQHHLRASGTMIETITVKYNPSVEQQQNYVASTSNSYISLDNSTSSLNLPADDQEQTVLKRIGNLLLKIKNLQEEMIRNSDKIKRCPVVASNKLDVNNMEQNDLKNWRDLWPAYEGKLNDDEFMDEEQRLRRTQELIDQYYFSSNDQKSVRSVDQQKRRLGPYGRERLERELPACQQLQMKQTVQSETLAILNPTEQQILKRRNLQNIEQHLPERQNCLEQSNRLGQIEQLEKQKHLLEHRQQKLNEQMIQKSQKKQQPDSEVEGTHIQQQRSQFCWKVGKFQVSPIQCYDEQLPLHDQLLRRIMKNKYVQIIKLYQQQKRSKFTTEDTTRTEIIMPGDTSNINTMRQTSRGSQLWWLVIGLPRQISPLVTGIKHQANLEQTPLSMMPISNLLQVTRPQLDDKIASIVEIRPKHMMTYSDECKLKKWMTTHLFNMMTDDEGKWLKQLQAKISQLKQQVDQHWKAMIDAQQQQVKLLMNSDKQLQSEKEKKRLEHENQIQQLKKRTPFQALPVHHQQTHSLHAAGQMRQQQSEIPLIVIDDDDEEESLNDSTVIDNKRETPSHPVFIDVDLLIHKKEIKVLYEDQHKGISSRWKQLEVIRKANQKQWELKIRNLFSYNETDRQFCMRLFERLIRKIKNPNLIKALEELYGEPIRYSERLKLQQQMILSKSQPEAEQPRMLHRKQKPSQKQAVKYRSQKIPTELENPKTSMLNNKSKKTIKQKRSTHKLALQKRPLNSQKEQKRKKQLPQHLNDTNKNQLKKSLEHQEAVNIRQLRSKRTIVVNETLQKRTKRPNHQNSKLQLQKKAVEQQEQFTTRWFQHSQMLMKIKTPAVTLRHVFLLRNRILQVNYNRNKRLRMQNQRSVTKQDINIYSTEMQIHQSRNKSTKLVLKKMAYTLHNQRSLLQRQLDRLNENHPDKTDEQLLSPISKTLIMSVRQPSITSLILPPLQTSTIKHQSLTSTVILSPQQPSTSIEQTTTSSIMLKSQIPVQPNQPTSSTSANQSCEQKQQVENKRQALKQQLNIVYNRLKPLMEMWRLSLQMPGSWLCQQLDDIELLRRKEFSNIPILQTAKHTNEKQQKQEILQNNEVSVVMDSDTMNHCSLQQLQRIREYLDWRQQRLRDLIEDLLILICPEQHPMLSVTSHQSSNCSVLIKLQQHTSLVEQINSKYSALLNLQSPSSWKHMQQQFSTYSLLLKLKQPITAKQQSMVYSTVLKLQQPPMPNQSSCLPMMTTTLQPPILKQQQSIGFVSENLIHNLTSIINKPMDFPNNKIQEKRRLSSGDETDDDYKRLKSSSKKRSKSGNNIISYKRSVPSLTKNTGIDKSLPIIDLVDSDDDIEILDSDSSTESSNEASFGVQVSEKSPLTIKIIKKKPLTCTQPVISSIENKSELNDLNSVIKSKKNINNIDLDKSLEKTHNKYLKEDKMMQLQDKGEGLKKLKSNEFEDNKTLTNEEMNSKDVMTGTSVHTTIVSRPTQISVLVNRPNEASEVINKSSDSNNQIFKVAVVECSSSMISNVGSNCINVVPEGRNTIKIMGGVINPTYVNSVDRTISVISKLTEAAVSVIRKTPTAVSQNHQPAVCPISMPMIKPISNLKMTKSMENPPIRNNRTEDNIEIIKKNKIVTTNHHCRIGTFSKTVRRYRRLNRTRWLESRGPAVPTFEDHGFAQGSIEQVVHGRFVTTIMTMSTAHTIASYIPPPIPRMSLDYASLYQPDENSMSSAMANSKSNVDNINNIHNIKTANTPVTPLSTMMSWIKKTAEISSNIACGNGHLWKGCARASGPTLMTLSKVTKEAISRNTAIRSRDTSSSSHLTNIPARLSRSSIKEPIPLVANSTKRSVSATVPILSFSNSKGEQQVIAKRSTSLTSSPPSVELHNKSKSTLVVPNISRKHQSNSVVHPTKRSASEAFSSVPLLTSEIMTDIAVPALETNISTSKQMVQPQKRSKSAVTTTDSSIINVSTLTKPSQREECLRPLKRSALVAEYVSPSITNTISDLSSPAVEPPKRSKSAAVITSIVETATTSNNNFIQPRSIKMSTSMALSPPSVQQTNKSKSAAAISSPFNKTSTIQPEPTLPNTTIPEFNILKTLPSATMLTAAPNDAKKNVLTNSVIENDDESDTSHEKTTTITDEEQRTVTVTRTICPTIPAPMDVTADACSLVTAACEQFIKSMVMELRLKTGRGAGPLQPRRRDAFAAAIAADDEIRPFPDFCRTPAIGTTIANQSILTHTQGEINDVEKEPVSEQISNTDSRSDKKFIVMTTDKPDYENEQRVVLKQQSIITDSKSNNKLSVLTVKTVIETQTTSSTTTTINKLHCPITITTDSAAKTRSSRSVIEGTSARTRGTLFLKNSRNSVSTSDSTSKQQTTGDRLSAKLIGAGKQTMSPPPVIAPEATAKPPSVASEATKMLPDTTLTFKTSKSTRGFFVERGRSLCRPTFNRRQPFGTLVDTAVAANSTSPNNTFFTDNSSQDSYTNICWPNDHHLTETWGCYFGDHKMLPPVSRLNNFLNIADKSEILSFEYHDGVDTGGGDDDIVHLAPSSGSTKLTHGIRKLNDNNAQEQMSFSNSLQQLIIMKTYQRRHIMELEKEMKRRIQELQNRKPDSQDVYYQKFLKLQFGSTKTPPKHSILRLPPNDHDSHSLINW